VEALFAELKNQVGLPRLRRMKFVREQFFLAAGAQNIKRVVRFLTHQNRHRANKRERQGARVPAWQEPESGIELQKYVR
jgi:hypothetical protein